MSPDALRRYRAERLLRKDFAGLRTKVLAIVRSQLRVKGVSLDPSDLEACYAQAWHGLYATVLEGEHIENPSAWLVLVTFRRAIDESRSAGRAQVGVEEDGVFEGHAGASSPDLAAELDDRALLRQVFEGFRANLTPREREAASLCYLQGLSRAEAAERMGIGEARMRKLMEGAGAGRHGIAGKVGDLLDTIRAGDWCEQQSSLMRAFAFGVLDPAGERHALAVAHCHECPACRAHVASLRGLASVLPLPLLSPLALAGSGASADVARATGAHGAGPPGAGPPPATRLATSGLRVGGRLTRGGWSGLTGSLTIKLAITAVVLIGGGYAALGGRAHGSPPVPHATAPPPPAGEALSRTPFRRLARAPHHADARGRKSSTPHSRLVSPARSRGGTNESEFLPERSREGLLLAPASVPKPPSAFTPSRSRTSPRATRDFGIE